MIFVFADDQTLKILNGIDEVRRDCEGIDVEEGLFQFFDETGALLVPDFIEPNKKGKLLGSFGWVQSGVFDLKKSKDIHSCTILDALGNAVAVEPNEFFDSLAAIKLFLESN
jgi:hypothetical protein